MAAATTVPAAQYLRVSTEHQQYSLQNQTDAIQGYAKRHGFETVRTYSDVGRSGVVLKDRPGLIRLLNDIISGAASFRAVLVYDVSRWGRFQDCDEAAHYEFICKSADVPVYYCAESFANDTSLPASIVKALKRAMAAEYSREMGTRSFAGAKRLAELGFKQGGVPGYGLRRLMISTDGHQRKILSTGEVKSLRTDRVILVPGPKEEVECVREMFRLVIEENRSPYFIAGELTRRGVTSPTGHWRLPTVIRILSDPKYAGYNVWGRTSYRLGSPRVSIARSHWVLKPGAFEPVVDPQLFEKAQAVLAEQRQPYSNAELLDSLRTLLRRHGTLSYKVITNSPGLASTNTFVKRFGSLRHAFELAGHTHQQTVPSEEQMREAAQSREQLLGHIASLFPGQVSIVRPQDDGPTCLQVEGKLTVSVVVCPAVRRGRYINWFVDGRWTQGTTVTLLARLDAENRQLRDYYALPRPGAHWIRRRRELNNSKQLADLSEFCAAAQAVASHQRASNHQRDRSVETHCRFDSKE